ncbi:MAG: hypothetical protein Fur0046_14880 [Cyanobacteria bacterium J069]
MRGGTNFGTSGEEENGAALAVLVPAGDNGLDKRPMRHPLRLLGLFYLDCSIGRADLDFRQFSLELELEPNKWCSQVVL